MFALLVLLFVTVPLAELALLIWVGGKLGLTATITLVVLTGILGASLARWQGLATLSRFQTRLASGQLPHEDLIDGILILVAGAVLLTPGLLTDLTGFALLVPAVRSGVRRWLVGRLQRRFVVLTPGGAVPTGGSGAGPVRSDPRGDVVDADFEVKE